MSENINKNVDFLIVKDGKMKESLERLLIIRDEIISTEEKIKFQYEEMVKTQKLIDNYKEFYDTQKDALDHFCAERDRLKSENIALLDTVNVLQKEEALNDKILKHRLCDSLGEIEHFKFEKSDIYDSNMDTSVNNNVSLKKILKSEILENPTEINENIDFTSFIPLPLSAPPEKIAPSENSVNKLKKRIKEKKKKKLKKTALNNADNVTTSIAEKKKSKKRLIKLSASDVNVTLKVPSTPLQKLFSIEPMYKIHRVHVTKTDTFMCGNNGFLSSRSNNGLSVINYRGHEDFYVYNFYVYEGFIVSIAHDYILIHNITQPNNHKLVNSFSTPISCTCFYKSKIYGALEDGVMFLIDLSDLRVITRGPIFPTLSKSMVIVQHNESLHLVVGMLNGDIVRYDLNAAESCCQKIGNVKDSVKGIIYNGSIIVSYTDKALYFINRTNWNLSLIRETSNVILFVDICSNKVIMADNCNNLHRYNLKKGVITMGSTIENVPTDSRISALCASDTDRKIFLACQSDLYFMKL